MVNLRRFCTAHLNPTLGSQNPHPLTLDLKTVCSLLLLTVENRVITGTVTRTGFHLYPNHKDRFDFVHQVLCRESVCGRCYWEIEWSGFVFISLSYKSISRKGEGKECWFGRNDQSWSLFCSPDRYSFIHNNIETKLPVKPIRRRTGECVCRRRIGVSVCDRRTGVSVGHRRIGVSVGHRRIGVSVCDRRTGVCVDYRRIGVYADPSAGTLSFYSISNTTSLIHTVQTTFTHTLYPGFWAHYNGSSVKLC
ncbi:NACHT, LRR and PYD domains-containing protein 12-like [Pimephales promelas]|nr:NACHT, LRR and PYD domains-containing protein 12-like [Pimephales promelas]